MARPLRIEYAGAVYHVTSRGDRREAIFLDDEDRVLWLELFGLVCERFNWRCHAWVLMDNHYHIVVEAVEGNLSKGMRQLNGVYTHAVLLLCVYHCSAIQLRWLRRWPFGLQVDSQRTY